jgi:hypothetical protein
MRDEGPPSPVLAPGRMKPRRTSRLMSSLNPSSRRTRSRGRGMLPHPIKKGVRRAGSGNGRNRRESDIPSNRLLRGHAQPMSCPVGISSPVRAVKALNTRWGTRLPLTAQFIGICFRQLARACGADQPFSYHRGSPQNQRQFRPLSLPAAYQQRPLVYFPCLVNGLLSAATCSQVTSG